MSVNEEYDLAIQYYKRKKILDCQKILLQILKKDQFHFKALLFLGSIYAQSKNYKIAKKYLNIAIKVEPDNYELLNNLGNIDYENGNFLKAIGFYKKSLNQNSNFDKANYNIAKAYNETNDYAKAEEFYNKAILINPKYINAYNNLGNLLLKLGRFEDAIIKFKSLININHKIPNGYLGIGNVYREIGDVENATKFYDQAINLDPKNLIFNWLNMTLFPKIYNNKKEIEFYRKRFEQNISVLNKLLKNINFYQDYQILEALNSSTNFLLTYQCKNDLKLQVSYADIVSTLSNKVFAKKILELKNKFESSSSMKISIGFVSAYFSSHSVSKTFNNWIKNINKKKFETSCFQIGNKTDSMTKKIAKYSNFFYSSSDLEKIVKKILFKNIHILIYLDIGMDPKTQILASLRLASLQCCTWGHPSTSGFKSIDYFISSEYLENDKSYTHYSEKVIKLPNIGTQYDEIKKFKLLKNKKSEISNKTILFSNHSLFKYLPENDHIFLDILKKIKNSEFHFFEGENKYITNRFRLRLEKLCIKNNVLFKDFFYFHKRTNYESYLKILDKADIFLDNIGFSGFNTGMEAINLNKPIVTMSNNFLRGRLVYSILKKISMNALIANTKEEYIRIVIKLATNSAFKKSIIKNINKNKKKLFNDKNYITVLENFFYSIKK